MSDFTDLYRECRLCPRVCGIDRTITPTGFCGEGARARVASACLHLGEEPPLSGTVGSGTVFFSGCTLKCPTCQNYQLSGEGWGTKVDTETLAEIFLALERSGAHNINLVTGTHFIPSIIEALVLARSKGACVPVVWNSSGYESPEMLEILHQFVDIYLPDLKTLHEETARLLFGRRDYPVVAEKALSAMTAAKPIAWEKGLLRQGVMIRHLVLPGRLDSTKTCLRWFAEKFAGRALLSLMFQYIPLKEGRRDGSDKISRAEQTAVLEMLEQFGIKDGFVQDLEDTDAWIPDFRNANPFPVASVRPIWHAKYGFLA
jgi:putative pyruvate formate lyase activating enzyme